VNRKNRDRTLIPRDSSLFLRLHLLDHSLPFSDKKTLLIDPEHGDGVGNDPQQVWAHAAIQGFPRFFPQDQVERLNE